MPLLYPLFSFSSTYLSGKLISRKG